MGVEGEWLYVEWRIFGMMLYKRAGLAQYNGSLMIANDLQGGNRRRRQTNEQEEQEQEEEQLTSVSQYIILPFTLSRNCQL